MVLLSEPDRMMLRMLVIGMFCVTNVSMQSSIVRSTGASETFTSGQYPHTGAVDHAWEITVDPNHQILLQFLDFSLNETTSCTVDVLEVMDGNQSSNVLIDSFCWDDITELTSAAYISSGNQFFIRLMTKDGYNRKGFKAQYTAVALQHTSLSGEIASPEYPRTGHGVDEAWRIKVEVDHHIRLEFIDFALHETDLCHDDYFELYDGSCNPYNLRGRWCFDDLDDFKQPFYMSTGNVFYLRLRTRHGHSRRGFNASYNSIPSNETDVSTPVCGSTTLPPPLTTKESNTAGKTGVHPVHRNSSTASAQGTTKTSTFTESNTAEKTGFQLGVVVSILAGTFFIAVVVAVIVWNYKMKKKKSVTHTGHNMRPQIERNNPGTYEDVNPQKGNKAEDSYDTLNGNTSAVDVSADVNSPHAEPYGGYTNKIFHQESARKANTPDGTYETPDVNVYTYANPNEMHSTSLD